MKAKQIKAKEEDQHCRICLDDSGTMLMASCECAGSVRCVHEECLLKWVMERMSKHPTGQISEMQCEICHTPYKMTVELELNPRWLGQTLATAQLRFFFVFALVMNAITIYSLLSTELNESHENAEQRTLHWISAGSLMTISIIFCGLAFWKVRDSQQEEVVRFSEEDIVDAAVAPSTPEGTIASLENEAVYIPVSNET